MTEHIDREGYETFMSALANEGYLAFGYNHLGHGDTARDDSELGFIASKDGWRYLVDDVSNAERKMKKEYGELPLYLLGHSMGSFIVRLAAAKAKPTKLIIMGTGGPNPAAGAGIALASLIKTFRGDHHISPFIENTAFGKYNERFDKTRKYDWLTKDRHVQDVYAADKFCTFHFTVSAMKDLVVMNKKCNEASWFADYDKSLPTLLVSGSEDPVGDYGSGVTKVYEGLKSAGCDVRMKLYENCRHEILNETCREETTKDIIDFIKE
jgi:alpha-beta hydrolase superfamily lysophospholipase